MSCANAVGQHLLRAVVCELTLYGRNLPTAAGAPLYGWPIADCLRPFLTLLYPWVAPPPIQEFKEKLHLTAGGLHRAASINLAELDTVTGGAEARAAGGAAAAAAGEAADQIGQSASAGGVLDAASAGGQLSAGAKPGGSSVGRGDSSQEAPGGWGGGDQKSRVRLLGVLASISAWNCSGARAALAGIPWPGPAGLPHCCTLLGDCSLMPLLPCTTALPAATAGKCGQVVPHRLPGAPGQVWQQAAAAVRRRWVGGVLMWHVLMVAWGADKN